MQRCLKQIFGPLLFLLVLGCKSKEESTVCRISVASSLHQVMTEFRDSLRINEGIDLVINSGSSGTLAQQIKQGIPCDMFCSADEKWLDFLDAKQDYERTVIAQNSVVLAFSGNKQFTISQSLKEDDIAIGNPEFVPLGAYVKFYFEQEGQSIPEHWLQLPSAMAVCKALELKEVDAGYIYESDALMSEEIVFKQALPNTEVNYLALNFSEKEVTIRVLEYLTSQKGRMIWDKYNFKSTFDSK